jgi:hypothetical protein
MVVVSRRARTHRGMVVGEHRDKEEREKQEEDLLTERLHGRQIGEERRGRFMRLESADDHSHDRPPTRTTATRQPQVEAAARQGGLRDPPSCVAEERRESREAGSRERRLGRCDRISGERGEGGSAGRAERETDLR